MTSNTGNLGKPWDLCWSTAHEKYMENWNRTGRENRHAGTIDHGIYSTSFHLRGSFGT